MPRQSSGRLDCQGRCPGQHALGRVPGQDGRFHTPEYEALPTVQAELVDETLGNNITNGCRTLRSTSALNSNNRKAQIFLPGTYVHYWRREMKETFKGILRVLRTETRRDNENEGSTGQLPSFPGAPRPGSILWLSRAGRLMTADTDTAETRFWERGSWSTTICFSPDAMDSPRRVTKAAEASVAGHLNRHS